MYIYIYIHANVLTQDALKMIQGAYKVHVLAPTKCKCRSNTSRSPALTKSISLTHVPKQKASGPAVQQLRASPPRWSSILKARGHPPAVLHVVLAFITPGTSRRQKTGIVSSMPDHVELRDHRKHFLSCSTS